MDIKQLQYFIEACKCRSLSKAAGKCFISSQGFSMSISRLEEELGEKLFKRTSSGVLLTPAGEYFYPQAVKIVSMVEECMQHFSGASRSELTLEVMFSRGTIEEFAYQCISSFKSKYPNVDLKILESTDLGCEAAVETGEVPLALTVGPIDHLKFSVVKVWTQKHALICRDDHPLAQKETILPEDVKGLRLAMTNRQTRSYPQLVQECAEYGFSPEVETFVDNPVLLFFLAEKSELCSISTYNLGKRQTNQHIKIIPFAGDFMDWSVYLIKRKNEPLPVPAQRFEEEVLQSMAPAGAEE